MKYYKSDVKYTMNMAHTYALREAGQQSCQNPIIIAKQQCVCHIFCYYYYTINENIVVKTCFLCTIVHIGRDASF